MKKYFLLYSLFFFLLAFLGCKKTSMYFWGTIDGLNANGKAIPRKEFTLSLDALKNRAGDCNSSYYTIFIRHHAKNDTLLEKIAINGLLHGGVGKKNLKYVPLSNCDTIPTARFYMSTGDLGIGDYVLLKDSDSFISIDNFNTQTNDIAGSFDLTFVADGTSSRSRAIYPDTIRFSGAKFTARVNPPLPDR
jgi:hypothetical protein